MNLRTSVSVTTLATLAASISVAALPTLALPAAGATTTSATTASDDFARKVAKSWGSAPQGGAWTLGTGNATPSVDGNRGAIAGVKPGQTVTARLASTQIAEVDATASFVVPSNAYIYYGLDARTQSDGSSYRATVIVRPDGTSSLAISRVKAGQATALAQVAVPPIKASNTFNVELMATGTSAVTLKARTWVSGGPVPNWQLERAETVGPLGAGVTGIAAYVSGSGVASPIILDKFAANPPLAPNSTAAPSPTATPTATPTSAPTATPTATATPSYLDWVQPEPSAVLPVFTEPSMPAGATPWPALPAPSVEVAYVNPRTNAAETYTFVDPTKVPSPGPASYSGYPRNGSGTFSLQAMDPATHEPTTVSYGAQKFIWADDIIAAEGATAYALKDGYNLRKLAWRASAIAESRGIYGVLVLGKATYYIPDFTDGYHSGVRFGTNGTNGAPAVVKISGLVGQGPASIVTPLPGLVPTTEQIAMVRQDSASTLNFATAVSFDNVPERVWVANFSAVFSSIIDPADGSPLHWNGIKVNNNNHGSVVERIGTRGFAPGFTSFPPGETFSLSFWRSNDAWVRDCFFDGRDLTGVRRSTSMLATNSLSNFRQERNKLQYGLAGMNTWWDTTNALSVFDESYSTSTGTTAVIVGGKTVTRSGTGLNMEETRGKIRIFFRRNVQIGRYSTDTTNPDLTSNGSLWAAIGSTKYDTGADTVVYEPSWGAKDYAKLNGVLAFEQYLNYGNSTMSAASVTRPLVFKGGKFLTGMDNRQLVSPWTYVSSLAVSANENFVSYR